MKCICFEYLLVLEYRPIAKTISAFSERQKSPGGLQKYNEIVKFSVFR